MLWQCEARVVLTFARVVNGYRAPRKWLLGLARLIFGIDDDCFLTKSPPPPGTAVLV
jgi:hypothetical protein